MNIVQPMTGTLLAQLSSISDNAEHFRSRYDSSFILTLLICLPMTVFLYCNSELVVHVLLGKQWLEFHSLFGLFSLFIFSLSVQHAANRLFIMNNNTRPIFLFEVCSIGIVLTPLFILEFQSIMAFSQIKVSIEVLLCVSYFLITYVIFFNLKLATDLGILASSLVCINYVSQSVSEQWVIGNIFIQLVVKGLIFGGSYCLLTYLWLLLVKQRVKEVDYIYQLFFDKLAPLIDKFKGLLSHKKL